MNWGNKLLVTFIVFGAGMGVLVYKSMNTTYELVEKDYYKKELRYQEVIDGSNRANALSAAASLQQTDSGIVLQFPEEMKNQAVTGSVLFYCAYNQKQDKRFDLEVNRDGVQVFNNAQVAPGKYTVKIGWNSNGTDYYTEKALTVL
jgi:hypothetical protein